MLARAVVMFWGPGEPGAMCLHRLRPGPLVRGVRDHTSHLMVPTCHLVSLCLLNAGWQAQGSQCLRHPKVHPSKGPVPCRDARRSLVSQGTKQELVPTSAGGGLLCQQQTDRKPGSKPQRERTQLGTVPCSHFLRKVQFL